MNRYKSTDGVVLPVSKYFFLSLSTPATQRYRVQNDHYWNMVSRHGFWNILAQAHTAVHAILANDIFENTRYEKCLIRTILKSLLP